MDDELKTLEAKIEKFRKLLRDGIIDGLTIESTGYVLDAFDEIMEGSR